MPFQDVCANYKRVHDEVLAACQKAGRKPEEVTLIAVSKGHSSDKLVALAKGADTGPVLVYGESYAQEALAKKKEVLALTEHLPNCPVLGWHFIGHIQSRKAKEVVGEFSLIHSVDSLKLAKNLDKAWHDRVKNGFTGPDSLEPCPQRILLQVNIGREAQKSGVDPDEAETLCQDVIKLKGLTVEGLMCLPPACENAEEVRPFFTALFALRERLRKTTGLALPHLSMGMSDDFMVAIEEGATMVRVGTDIFGAREKK